MHKTQETLLVERIVSGEKDLFREIVAEYKDMLFGLSLRMVGNTSEAEEILQESFVQIYLHLPSFKSKSSLKTWVYTICYRQCTKWYAQKKKRPFYLEFEQNVNLADEVEIEEEFTKEDIAKAISTLKPGEARVLEMYYYDNLRTYEVAEITGFSEAKVKSMLFRIRNKIKIELVTKK